MAFEGIERLLNVGIPQIFYLKTSMVIEVIIMSIQLILMMKIIKALAQNEELTISLIINKTKSNHTVVVKHLHYLIELGLIQEKKFGRIKVYKYKLEDIRARSLARFIEIWESSTRWSE